ncbi:hypothetical protein AK830_g9365 [Neonectria ditissima]|uniref:Golgi to ER traffic protein 2 n=1 Tax=Neonectria ditissima TaxID=78410 RepID=A0A0P7BCJ2_9HYPO|nr:hypothetical protein AK830_g9365 [Neonectria ditissima]
MTENVLSPEDAAAQRASEQARLRKERREAKIKAGGSARLNKITGASGGIPRGEFCPVSVELRCVSLTSMPPRLDPEPAPAPSIVDPTAAAPASTPTPAPRPAPSQPHADPDEVDISEHFYEPTKAGGRGDIPGGPNMTEDDLRQMMLGFERGADPRQPSPGPGPGANLDEDPMMKMMSQLMSGAGLPPGSASPFPGMPGGANPFQPAPAPSSSTSTNIWRLLHALVALGLGLYIVVLTPFTGSKIERERAALPIATNPDDPFSTPVDALDVESELEHRKRLFFWTFATAETLLLTTRFFLDKRGPPPTGVVGTVIGFLPQPIKGYIEIVLRYARIFTTVRGDVLACIFVLGLCSWFRG